MIQTNLYCCTSNKAEHEHKKGGKRGENSFPLKKHPIQVLTYTHTHTRAHTHTPIHRKHAYIW